MKIEPVKLLIRHQGGWLDINAPHHETSGSPLTAGTLCEAAACQDTVLLQRVEAGGWQVQPTLLWSLLDPLQPRPPAADCTAAAAVRRVWDRLSWWQRLPAADRQSVGALLDRCARGGGELVTVLDRLAAAGSPLGAIAAKPPPAPPLEPMNLPEDPAALAAFCLDPAGLGALCGQSYTVRIQQAELAAAVARALIARQPLLAEAGTGIGKTLAYLLPLAARLMAGRGRAVVSTYSRTLQTQILQGDFPRLAAARPDLSARLLMGRAHYLCLRQRRDYLGRPVADGPQAAAAAALRLWLLATTEGLRDELAQHPLLAAQVGELFSGVQPCLPGCWDEPGCFVVRARRLAREAQLVVVNHALLLSDQAAGGSLIGPITDLIVDEAHRLPQVVLDASTVRLGPNRLVELDELVGAPRLSGQPPETTVLLAARLRAAAADQAGAAAEAFGQAVARCQRAYRQWWHQAGEVLAISAAAPAGQRQRIADKEIAFKPLAEATAALSDSAAAAAAAAAALGQRAEALTQSERDLTDLLARCAQAGLLLGQLQRDVRFVTSDPSDRWVTWLEPGAQGVLRQVGATPLESGPLLRELWSGAQLSPVATSATLALGQDFGFMLGELGLAGRRPPAATLAVDSPFDWQKQTLCLALETLPEPDHPEFVDAVTEILADLRREVGRQTLVLFTAYRLLQDVAQRLQRLEEGAGLFAAPPAAELLVQTPQTAAAELGERFRRGRRIMLLGTSTFWEGVDFPGASLEILVVTKLPFLVPNDPWVEARCQHLRSAGEDPFREFMLRDAVLRLRQGVGRLLRRETDRGVVLLLDNRLITRNYGATFLAALPAPLRWLSGRGELTATIRDFLEKP